MGSSVRGVGVSPCIALGPGSPRGQTECPILRAEAQRACPRLRMPLTFCHGHDLRLQGSWPPPSSSCSGETGQARLPTRWVVGSYMVARARTHQQGEGGLKGKTCEMSSDTDFFIHMVMGNAPPAGQSACCFYKAILPMMTPTMKNSTTSASSRALRPSSLPVAAEARAGVGLLLRTAFRIRSPSSSCWSGGEGHSWDKSRAGADHAQPGLVEQAETRKPRPSEERGRGP